MSDKKRAVINIINFIRGYDARKAEDLTVPVVNQLELLKKHGMTGTFLMQYNSLDDRFISLLKDTPHEIGAWFEMDVSQVEAAGIEWHGRYPWDWHSDVGFLVGYTPKQREAIIDVFMEKFRQVWGYYPKTAGSWMLDAHSLSYMADKYGLEAACICKEQWGTDGYTLWGGYYSPAYYPSKNNLFVPAQTREGQINVPVFRMLGSDPIYQYDAGLSVEKDGATEWQGVITLEPVYTGGGDSKGGGGGVPEWVDWYLDDVMSSPSLTFNYAQAGQENSFDWPAMKDGLTYQFEKLEVLQKEDKVIIEPFFTTGQRYSDAYPETPNSAMTALSDWKDEGRKSVWFSSKHYRVNIYYDNHGLRIRDLMLFDENYSERYLEKRCESPAMVYDTFPVVDGNRWSGNGIYAGWYSSSCGQTLKINDIHVTEQGDVLRINIFAEQGTLEILCGTERIIFNTNIPDFSLEMKWNKSTEMEGRSVSLKRLDMTHEGYSYSLMLEDGVFDGTSVKAENGRISMKSAGAN